MVCVGKQKPAILIRVVNFQSWEVIQSDLFTASDFFITLSVFGNTKGKKEKKISINLVYISMKYHTLQMRLWPVFFPVQIVN